ncbi:MAG: hypothetical protein A2287_00970 [Candidatus Melainabacteria bacterium RIFOXYA12_FULL_32_12]|nr:MAG: hypothetical protein A2255_08090 [Candidatus Melainabacteria bacterium RIFOXYA2_FULL_32_9]OGI25284.1 MAG: hypothetical protein A2287_00970 [Candidatus Melainabacteria bacterium RIFOXYA12_FULL_32_12]
MINHKDIENIIESYNAKIQGVIKRFNKTENDIDDIKQEIYIKTWKNISKYRGDSNIWSWLNKITINTCKDYLRSSKSHLMTDSDPEKIIQNIPDKKLCPEKNTILSERQKLILDSINKLNPKLREVIILYDIEDLTYEEIANKTKRPIGTVKSRLFNARKALREELKTLLN